MNVPKTAVVSTLALLVSTPWAAEPTPMVTDTYIRRDGINHDYGPHDSPDAVYAGRGANLSGSKRRVFQRWVRHGMNRSVGRIRSSACA
jgi:hypothetical protein